MEACEVADKLNLVKPIADQCEYSLIVRDNLDKAYHSVFEKFGYGTTIWSPLGSGVLTGKRAPPPLTTKLFSIAYINSRIAELVLNLVCLSGKYLDGNVPEGSRMSLKGFEGLGNFYLTEENLKKVADMKPIAERLGCSLTQLSLGFCYVNPHVSTVILVSCLIWISTMLFPNGLKPLSDAGCYIG